MEIRIRSPLYGKQTHFFSNSFCLKYFSVGFKLHFKRYIPISFESISNTLKKDERSQSLKVSHKNSPGATVLFKWINRSGARNQESFPSGLYFTSIGFLR